MTLLFVAGSWDREDLLELLEAALEGGRLDPADGVLAGEAGEDYDLDEDDELEEYEDEYDDEDDDEDDEYEDEDLLQALPPVLLESQGIAPYSEVRATAKGLEFLFVASALERWLRRCPDGPLELGEMGAQAIAPLVCCWSATVTHALAARPLTLPELQYAVGILDHETTEEHVEAMVAVGQVATQTAGGKTYYALTDWMREGIAPIIAAARYEAHYPEDDVAPPDILDVEAAFQLVLPLMQLPPDLHDSCRLGVQIPGGEPLMAGATAQVDRGRVVSSSTLLEERPENWVTGSPVDWMDAVVDPAAAKLETGGDLRLGNALLESLHRTLFGMPEP